MSVTGTTTGPADGPNVVLIHGLAGSHRTWQQVVPLLEDRFRLLTVDLAGGRPIEEEADGTAQLLPGRSVVVGHSMGGLVATALAERHPGLVTRLILINTPPRNGSRRGARSPQERILRVPMLGCVVWMAAGQARRQAGLRSTVAPGTAVPRIALEDLDATGRARLTGSTAAIDRYLAARPLAERLASLGKPTDVVFGLRDQRVDPASLSVYDGLSGVRITRLPASGHTPPWEAPDVVAAVVADAAV